MNNNLSMFLNRFFLYRAQYVIAAISAIIIFSILSQVPKFLEFLGYIFIFSVFNTVTYLCSNYLADKYGIEMFADLDQDWLKEHQGFDSKAFGDIFARLIECRKIAGPYMLAVIIPCCVIDVFFATLVGIAYLVGYFIYRHTYLDAAISYKIPRAFGNSLIVSKVLGEKNDQRN